MNWDWFLIPTLILICVGSVAYLYKGAKDEDEIQDELEEHVIRQLREGDQDDGRGI